MIELTEVQGKTVACELTNSMVLVKSKEKEVPVMTREVSSMEMERVFAVGEGSLTIVAI